MPKDTGARKGSMAEHVYEGVKADLFSFRLMPGDRFSEGEIGSRLRASRTPVREALYRLQQEGYVEVLFRSGWRVKPLDPKQLDDLFELRLTIELAAVDKLCSSPETNLQLRALLRLQSPPSVSGRGITGPDRPPEACFHHALVRAAGNQEMVRIHREVSERLRLALALGLHKRGKAGKPATHGEILSALLVRNITRAKSLLTDHIRNAQQVVSEITREDGGHSLTEPATTTESRYRAHKY
ncbi:GntR family transcriptional regulator [Marinobacter salinisoli]|uniref:GntR family transcriptional regulator n=1 Tax=Marinobacter salinisoli TaxID=2769486 RepID=A0ABX7MR76_9GAMM|nr:GntR family transcriptional regulator [Marinobacter salinisoli]QSP94845.1 GntR family transcriptional regulator [Marinobacter salinisoli]QSP94857.1 GntR family transcriptional regulator [Marinobacter salinisoli]